MISISSVIQIVVAFLGFISAIFVLWFGNTFKWSNEMMFMVSICIGIGTILIEVIISSNSLRSSIEKLHPVLELYPNEQKEVHSLVFFKSQLSKRINEPQVLIAIEQFKKASAILKSAYNNNDFFVDNTFEANMLALSLMKKGQTFLGLSGVINPDYWNHDKQFVKYKELNYSQIQNGVIIKRIFIFNNKDEYNYMKNVMFEQANNGVNVFFCYKENLHNITHYPDFSIIEDLNLCLIVPKGSKLLTVTVSNNPDLISECQSQFTKILEKSTKVEVKEDDNNV